MGVDNDDILEEWPSIASHLEEMDLEREESFEKKVGFDIDDDRYPGRRYGDMEVEKWVPHKMLDNAKTLAKEDIDNILVGQTLPMDVVYGNSRLAMRKIGGYQIEAIQESTGSIREYAHEEGDGEHSLIIREETLPSDNLRPITTAKKYDVPVGIPEDYVESLRDIDGDRYTADQAHCLADEFEEQIQILDEPTEESSILDIADSRYGNTGVLAYSSDIQKEWEGGEYDSVIPLTPKMTDRHIQHVNE